MINRKELLSAKVLIYQATMKQKEGLRRVSEEKNLIMTLKSIIKKMNKKISHTAQEREELRINVIQ